MNMLSVGKSCQSRICNSEVEGGVEVIVEVIVTVFVGDHSLTTEVSTEQRACALTWYVPAEVQAWLAVGELLQEEKVPSPQ